MDDEDDDDEGALSWDALGKKKKAPSHRALEEFEERRAQRAAERRAEAVEEVRPLARPRREPGDEAWVDRHTYGDRAAAEYARRVEEVRDESKERRARENRKIAREAREAEEGDAEDGGRAKRRRRDDGGARAGEAKQSAGVPVRRRTDPILVTPEDEKYDLPGVVTGAKRKKAPPATGTTAVPPTSAATGTGNGGTGTGENGGTGKLPHAAQNAGIAPMVLNFESTVSIARNSQVKRTRNGEVMMSENEDRKNLLPDHPKPRPRVRIIRNKAGHDSKIGKIGGGTSLAPGGASSRRENVVQKAEAKSDRRPGVTVRGVEVASSSKAGGGDASSRAAAVASSRAAAAASSRAKAAASARTPTQKSLLGDEIDIDSFGDEIEAAMSPIGAFSPPRRTKPSPPAVLQRALKKRKKEDGKASPQKVAGPKKKPAFPGGKQAVDALPLRAKDVPDDEVRCNINMGKYQKC